MVVLVDHEAEEADRESASPFGKFRQAVDDGVRREVEVRHDDKLVAVELGEWVGEVD